MSECVRDFEKMTGKSMTEPVVMIDSIANVKVREYPSVSEASRQVLKGRIKTAGGYVWRYSAEQRWIRRRRR